MCAPIPKGKWAWRYNKCIRCETKKIKHKGNGYCLRCYDYIRNQTPKGKIRRTKAKIKWYLKFRKNPNYKEIVNKHSEKWRLDEKTGYKLYLQKTSIKGKFKRFLNRKRLLKRDLGGVEFICQGCEKKCKIISPIKPKEIVNKIYELKMFKKIVIKNCKKQG